MRRVIIESPYAGDVELNVEYARFCLRDSIARGEAPFASHLLYTQVLNDKLPVERNLGINMNLRWIDLGPEVLAVYDDLGVSEGMNQALAVARSMDYSDISVELRSIFHIPEVMGLDPLTYFSGMSPRLLHHLLSMR